MTMKDITIFIDESGTLSDPKDKVLINESAFYELFKGKVISEKVVSWKNLRREFFSQKKSR